MQELGSANWTMVNGVPYPSNFSWTRVANRAFAGKDELAQGNKPQLTLAEEQAKKAALAPGPSEFSQKMDAFLESMHSLNPGWYNKATGRDTDKQKEDIKIFLDGDPIHNIMVEKARKEFENQ